MNGAILQYPVNDRRPGLGHVSATPHSSREREADHYSVFAIPNGKNADRRMGIADFKDPMEFISSR